MDNNINSKEINIYYLKTTYPVKVIYEISSDDNAKIAEWNETILAADPTLIHDGDEINYNGNIYYKQFYKIEKDQKYNTTFSESAPTLGGFRLSGSQQKSIIVLDDDSFSKNKIDFIYTVVEDIMFYYNAVIPDGSSTKVADPDDLKLLSINQESVEIGVRPQMVKAEEENPLYNFIGWYTDRDCTNPVSDNVLSGTKRNELTPMGSNVDVSYYAKYDYKRGDLDLIVTESDDENQCFEFVIKGKDENNEWLELKVCIQGNGKKTIRDLPIGEYTITQTDWSWRYTSSPDNASVVIEESDPQSVTFNESMSNNKWLDGNAYKDNNFKKQTE